MRSPLTALSGLVGVVLVGTFAAVTSGDALAGPADAEPTTVLVTEIASPITPVVADVVSDGLERAAAEGHAAYIIKLDTPGGLMEAMRDINSDILASRVPVIVYVAPDGARAGSAGAYIALAAHVAVMAPGTTIGAATPVGLEGQQVSDKIVNDAVAQAVALARLRNRDVEFAEDMVRDGRSVDVDEAVELGVVEARANSLTDALDAADGLVVTGPGQREMVVHSADATVERHDFGRLRSVLQFLADPNIAFLLLTLGTLGLIYELATPGVGVAGATGVTALLLALFSLSVLPVNVVGLLLLAVAAALFAAEVFAPGVAGFGFGGAVVLVLAAVFLFDDGTGVAVDPTAALPLAVLMFVAAVVAGRVAMHTRRLPSTTTGADAIIGHRVKVVEAEGSTGRAMVQGSWWSLRSTGEALHAGAEGLVVGIDGLVLVVDPDDTEPTTSQRDEERGTT